MNATTPRQTGIVDDALRELMANELERLDNSRPPYFDQLEHLEGTDRQWFIEWNSFEMLADLYLDGGVSSDTAIRILNYWQQPDLASAPPLQLDLSPEQLQIREQLEIQFATLNVIFPGFNSISDDPSQWGPERRAFEDLKRHYLPYIVRYRTLQD